MGHKIASHTIIRIIKQNLHERSTLPKCTDAPDRYQRCQGVTSLSLGVVLISILGSSELGKCTPLRQVLRLSLIACEGRAQRVRGSFRSSPHLSGSCSVPGSALPSLGPDGSDVAFDFCLRYLAVSAGFRAVFAGDRFRRAVRSDDSFSSFARCCAEPRNVPPGYFPPSIPFSGPSWVRLTLRVRPESGPRRRHRSPELLLPH